MKLNILLVTMCIMNSGLYAKDWKNFIEDNKACIEEKTYDLISSQHIAFSNKKLPKITDPEIKSISIEESNEIVIDINAHHHNRIDMLPYPETPWLSPDYNAGLESCSKIRKTVYLKLNKMIEQLDALAPIFGYSEGQISIKVFEGLRDIKTQESIFNTKAQEIKEKNPLLTEEEIFSETSKWVSPTRNNIPVHSTGAAIDIRLWDARANTFLDMGMFGVIWGQNEGAPTFSESLTDIQKNNRLYLLLAAASADLVNYPYEWWHFSSGDRYAEFWQVDEEASRKAIYGPA